MYLLQHQTKQSFHKIHLQRANSKSTHTHTHTHTRTHTHTHLFTHLFTQQDKNAFTTSISRTPTSKGDKRTKLSHTKQRERTRENLKPSQVLKLT